jgi:hypothetical protein
MLKAMNVKIPYHILLNLPRPVKKIDHPYAKLSADKRSVRIEFDMAEVLGRNDLLSYRIEY